MRFTDLFNGPFHECLDEDNKKDVDKKHIEWIREMLSFLAVGIVLGIIIGILL